VGFWRVNFLHRPFVVAPPRGQDYHVSCGFCIAPAEIA
jgi:hypothetical protein